MYAPWWHPTLPSVGRPPWLQTHPSPAALSYNFAIDQYKQPLCYGEFEYDVASSALHNQKKSYQFIEALDKQIQGIVNCFGLMASFVRVNFFRLTESFGLIDLELNCLATGLGVEVKLSAQNALCLLIVHCDSNYPTGQNDSLELKFAKFAPAKNWEK